MFALAHASFPAVSHRFCCGAAPRLTSVRRCFSAACASAAPTTQPVEVARRAGALDDAHLRRIGENDAALRHAYDAAPAEYPAHSQAPGEVPVDGDAALRKRLLYRSRQRGWLEVDLLLGTWASKYLHTLSGPDLRVYESILNVETVDLFNMLMHRGPAPAHLEDTPLLRSILAFTADSPLGKASAEAYALAKKAMAN